ncbi:MAG: hypothetical protein IKX53_09565 [Bacteroidales bacterium]|nr:hypothetical protein [Bacteroidales bacterium]
MRKKRTILTLILLLTVILPVRAQYVLSGSAPAGTRWSQLKGEHFDLIYPTEIDSLARVYLYTFEKTRTATLTGLRIETPHMPMILQPYDMYSNGMVAWAPRRIELYTTPLGDPLYALNWEMQLAVHEGRHIGQMAHYTKGLYHVLNLLAGEQGSAVGIGLYPSRVLLEGDAVENETDLTAAGRGRDPEFLKYFRASFLAGDFRSWANWRYGSYRYYTPGKYQLGYMVVSTMRYNSHNYTATGDIMSIQVRDWWRVFSVSHRAYIRATGLTGRKNWRSAIARYTEQWSWEEKLRAPFTPVEPLLARRDSVYTEISNPVRLADATYATMSGMQYERRLVSIDSTGTRHYRRPLSSNTSTLVPDSDHSLLFSEIVPDPRWEHRSWSVIRRYDAEKNRFETLTHRTRYLNPTPSAGRDSILAAEYRVEGGSNVVILDRNGRLIDRIAAPENGQVTGVAQLKDALYASVITTEGIGLFRYDGHWSQLVRPQSRMIRNLQAAGDSLLYFVSDLNGVNNLYTLEPDHRNLKRITSVRFSAEKPSLDADGILRFGNYDNLGYQPVAIPFDSLSAARAVFIDPYVPMIAEANSRQAREETQELSIMDDILLRRHIDSLETRPYNKVLHGIHIHSWAPFYANVDRLMNDLGGFDSQHFSNWYEYIAPGATVMSQNHLGTLVTTLGYSYHAKHHAGHFYANYSGWYPVFELSVDYNHRDRTKSYGDAWAHMNTLPRIDTLGAPAWAVNTKMSIPLVFSQGGWTTRVTPAIGFSMTNDAFEFREYQEGDLVLTTGERTQLLTGSLRFDTRLARPTSRLTPRLGFGFQVSGMTRIGPARNNIGAVTAWTYLPGFGKEDGFKLSYSYQYQPENGLFYSADYNLVRKPFGFSRDILMNYNRATLEYALPVYAGDLDAGFLFYLKRFILVPFVDVGFDKAHPDPPEILSDSNYVLLPTAPQSWLSYGSALLVNTRIFRIGTDFQFGVRYARRNIPGDKGKFQFIISTGL